MKKVDALLIFLILLLLCLICKKHDGFQTTKTPEYINLNINIPKLYH